MASRQKIFFFSNKHWLNGLVTASETTESRDAFPCINKGILLQGLRGEKQKGLVSREQFVSPDSVCCWSCRSSSCWGSALEPVLPSDSWWCRGAPGELFPVAVTTGQARGAYGSQPVTGGLFELKCHGFLGGILAKECRAMGFSCSWVWTTEAEWPGFLFQLGHLLAL